MTLNIHQPIKDKLNYFLKINKIPNIIFHGTCGSGKKTIVNEFIYNIYNNEKEQIKNLVLYVNCSQGKGIKFIREDVKFFAKTHINVNYGNIFKSIVLLNVDKLSIDAQSALRRCIELFSHNTRFFIIAENKYNLMKPILSRFCEIYIPEPPVNLYQYNLSNVFKTKDTNSHRLEWLKKKIQTYAIKTELTVNELMTIAVQIYEKGYSGLDIIYLLKKNTYLENLITIEKKYELLMCLSRIRKEFRNEKLIILFILNFLFISSNISLENISFM